MEVSSIGIRYLSLGTYLAGIQQTPGPVSEGDSDCDSTEIITEHGSYSSLSTPHTGHVALIEGSQHTQ